MLKNIALVARWLWSFRLGFVWELHGNEKGGGLRVFSLSFFGCLTPARVISDGTLKYRYREVLEG